MTMLPPYPKSLSTMKILAMRETAMKFQTKAEKAAERPEFATKADALLEIADEFAMLAGRLDEAADHAGVLEDYLENYLDGGNQ